MLSRPDSLAREADPYSLLAATKAEAQSEDQDRAQMRIRFSQLV